MRKKEIETMQDLNNTPEPAGFREWIYNTVFKDDYKFFFQKIRDGIYLGFCQHCKKLSIPIIKPELKETNDIVEYGCGSSMPYETPKTGKTQSCPACGRKVLFKDMQYNQSLYDDKQVSFLLETSDGRFILRKYKVRRNTNFLDFNFKIEELEREIWSPSTHTNCSYHLTHNNNWIRDVYPNMFGSFKQHIYLFPGNLGFLNRSYPYCQLQAVAKHIEIDAIGYLKAYSEYPQMEYLAKLKLHSLIKEFASYSLGTVTTILDLKQKSIKQLLKLDSQEYVDFVIKTDAGLKDISTLQYMLSQGLRPNQELLNFVEHHIVNTKYHTKWKEVTDFVGIQGIYNYAKEQKLDGDDSHIFRDYLDYYSACKRLKYDMNDTMFLKPKNFKAAHDRVFELIKQLDDKEKKAQAAKAARIAAKLFAQQAKQFNYQNKDLMIIAPKKTQDVKDEGHALSHCVGSYIDRIVAGNSIILFVRKTKCPDKSLCTVELNPHTYKVVQWRGYKNNPFPEQKEVKKFIDTWFAQIVQPKIAVQAAS